MNYAKNDWNAIKQHYAMCAPEIAAARADQWAIDPYAWDGKGMIFLTPIEQNFWSDIRSTGLVLYPQYPECGFFLDFANPSVKVAIECDGAEFHTDWQKDREREKVLQSNGWKIYRISGRQCNEDWEQESVDVPAGVKLCKMIGDRHQIRCGVRRSNQSGWISSLEGVESHLEKLISRLSADQAGVA
jgi:very-short-patch-repair endonuclease